ncbi:MAG: peptidoglycan DD-metalloendopeptidase family protein [Patescibacteria group bacterium]|nr:peptidoglycan DD-metalloendopeptidase family protein [Patescibacteria group bacterium]
MIKTAKSIILVLFLCIVFNAPVFALGQEGSDASSSAVNTEIKQLNKEIQDKKNKTEEIQRRQKIYQKTIRQKQAEKANLNNQLAILENRVAKTLLDIENVEVDMDRVSLEIKKVNIEIADQDKQIIKEKSHLSATLNLMHKEDSKTSLEIMLLNNSFTEFISQIKYLEDINGEIGRSLNALKQHKKQLNNQKIALAEQKQEFEDLKQDMRDKKTLLINEKGNKTFILDQTRSSEKEYQRLLSRARQEQAQAAAEIVSLEKMVRAKITEMQGGKLEFNDAGIIWPVTKNVITAYFHDPEYPFRYIFEHPGVDVRAAQGTTIKAAASGYVARAKDAGKGYSYIMIVHGDGLATVYGHVLKIYVSEDEYIVQGQTIGLTGGLPGTHGAGRLTTGPHLHFEVRLNGIPVNPLEYLP